MASFFEKAVNVAKVVAKEAAEAQDRHRSMAEASDISQVRGDGSQTQKNGRPLAALGEIAERLVGRDGDVAKAVEAIPLGGLITAPLHRAGGHHDHADAAIAAAADTAVSFGRELLEGKGMKEAVLGVDGVLAKASAAAGGTLGLPAVVLHARAGKYMHALWTYGGDGSGQVTVAAALSLTLKFDRNLMVRPQVSAFELLQLDITSKSELRNAKDFLLDDLLPKLGLDLASMVEKKAAGSIVGTKVSLQTAEHKHVAVQAHGQLLANSKTQHWFSASLHGKRNDKISLKSALGRQVVVNHEQKLYADASSDTRSPMKLVKVTEGDGTIFLQSESGDYISHRDECVLACNVGSKLSLTFRTAETEKVNTIQHAVATVMHDVHQSVCEAMIAANAKLRDEHSRRPFLCCVLQREIYVEQQASERVVEAVQKLKLRHLLGGSELSEAVATKQSTVPQFCMIPSMLEWTKMESKLKSLARSLQIFGMPTPASLDASTLTSQQLQFAFWACVVALASMFTAAFRMLTALLLSAYLWDHAARAVISESVEDNQTRSDLQTRTGKMLFVDIEDTELGKVTGQVLCFISKLLRHECLAAIVIFVLTCMLRSMYLFSFSSSFTVVTLGSFIRLINRPDVFFRTCLHFLTFVFLLVFRLRGFNDSPLLQKNLRQLLIIGASVLNPSAITDLVDTTAVPLRFVASLDMLEAYRNCALVLTVAKGELQLSIAIPDETVDEIVEEKCKKQTQMELLDILKNSETLDGEIVEDAHLTACNAKLCWKSANELQIVADATVQLAFSNPH